MVWNGILSHTQPPQELYIRYNLTMIEEENGFIAFFIPYPGNLKQDSEWEIASFPETSSTLIYKKYECSVEEPCNADDGQIIFNIEGSLNAYRSFKNYIQIPVDTSPVHSKAIQLINKLAGKPSFNFGWSESTKPILKITLPKNTDEWDERPTSGLEVFTKQDGTNHNVLKWNIEGNSIIQVEYADTKDWFLSQNYATLMAVLLTLGAAFIFTSVESKRSGQSMYYLRDALSKTESRISQTLDEIKEFAEDEVEEEERKLNEENEKREKLMEQIKKNLVEILDLSKTLEESSPSKERLPDLRTWKLIKLRTEVISTIVTGSMTLLDMDLVYRTLEYLNYMKGQFGVAKNKSRVSYIWFTKHTKSFLDKFFSEHVEERRILLEDMEEMAKWAEKEHEKQIEEEMEKRLEWYEENYDPELYQNDVKEIDDSKESDKKQNKDSE